MRLLATTLKLFTAAKQGVTLSAVAERAGHQRTVVSRGRIIARDGRFLEPRQGWQAQTNGGAYAFPSSDDGDYENRSPTIASLFDQSALARSGSSA